MKCRSQIRTGFVSVLIAGIFLCNPVSAFVDILPNCIGYWLLCYGLYRLADLNGHIFEAVRRFRILSVLSVAQLLVASFAYGVIEPQATNVYELRSFLMLGAFLMLIAQWFFLIPAFRELFCGLDYLADRHTAQSLTCKKRGRTVVNRMAAKTRVFIIISSLMAFLPELSGFSSLDGKGENGTPGFNVEWYSSVLFSPSQTVDRYGYIHILRILCGTVALIAAVIWLVSFVRFIHRILRQREWLQTLDTRYREEILPQMGMLTVRRFSRSFYLLQFAIVFTASLRMSFYEVLPGAVFALLAFLALWTVRRLVKVPPVFYAACVMCAVVSIVQMVVNSFYLARFDPEAALYIAEAYERFLIVRILNAAEAVLTLILTAVLLYTLYRVACAHTGVCYGDDKSEALSRFSAQRLHQRFGARFKVVFAFFALSAVVCIADAVLRPQYQWLWLPAFALSFGGIMLFYSVIYELKSEISFRYASDGMNKNI